MRGCFCLRLFSCTAMHKVAQILLSTHLHARRHHTAQEILLDLATDDPHTMERGKLQTFSRGLACRRPLLRERLQLRLHRGQALLCALQIDLLILQHLQMTAPQAFSSDKVQTGLSTRTGLW